MQRNAVGRDGTSLYSHTSFTPFTPEQYTFLGLTALCPAAGRRRPPFYSHTSFTPFTPEQYTLLGLPALRPAASHRRPLLPLPDRPAATTACLPDRPLSFSQRGGQWWRY